MSHVAAFLLGALVATLVIGAVLTWFFWGYKPMGY
jgi:hypothetical protein